MNEEIKIIEDFLNYNTNKQLSGIEINAISKLLNCYYKQQKEIEELREENFNKVYTKIFEYTCGKSDIEKMMNIINKQQKEIENSISKDKIREKIKEYKKQIEKDKKEIKESILRSVVISDKEEKIEILKQLLED